jgi:hypothetical protein
MDNRRGSRRLGRGLPRRALIWVAIAVVGLVVIDVVLVALAAGRTAPTQHGTPGPIPTFSSTPSADGPSRTPTAAPGETAVPEAAGSDQRRLLTALNGREAWRASGGTCDGDAPVLQHTTNGGQDWVTVALGADVREMAALRATDDGLSVLVAVGDDCTPTVRTSTDDGATWVAGQRGAAGSGIDGDSIELPSGRIESPCASPVDAYQGQYTTVVACADEVDWRSGTGAWVHVPVPGIQAIADAGNTYTLARLGASTCSGLQIVSLPATQVTPNTKVRPIGCWTEAGSDGPAAIDLVGKSLWAWLGDEVAVSADGGASW